MAVLEQLQQQINITSSQLGREQVQQSIVNRNRQLVGAPAKQFSDSTNKLKSQIKEYNSEVDRLKNLEDSGNIEALKAAVNSLSPKDRYLAGDKSIELYQEYDTTYFLEDTGKRINGEKVYKVTDRPDLGEFVGNPSNFHTGEYYGKGNDKVLYGKQLINGNVVDNTLKYSHNGQEVNGKYVVGWYTTKDVLQNNPNIQTVETSKYNPNDWQEGSRYIPTIDREYQSTQVALKTGKAQATKVLEKELKDKYGYVPRSAAGNYEELKRFKATKEANALIYQTAKTNRQIKQSYQKRAKEELTSFAAKNAEKVKALIPQLQEKAKADLEAGAYSVSFKVDNQEVTFFKGAEIKEAKAPLFLTEQSKVQKYDTFKGKFYKKVYEETPVNFLRTVKAFKEINEASFKEAPLQKIYIGTLGAVTLAYGGGLISGGLFGASSRAAAGTAKLLKATPITRPIGKGLSFIGKGLTSGAAQKLFKFSFAGSEGFRITRGSEAISKKEGKTASLFYISYEVAKDAAFIYAFDKSFKSSSNFIAKYQAKRDAIKLDKLLTAYEQGTYRTPSQQFGDFFANNRLLRSRLASATGARIKRPKAVARPIRSNKGYSRKNRPTPIAELSKRSFNQNYNPNVKNYGDILFEKQGKFRKITKKDFDLIPIDNRGNKKLIQSGVTKLIYQKGSPTVVKGRETFFPRSTTGEILNRALTSPPKLSKKYPRGFGGQIDRPTLLTVQQEISLNNLKAPKRQIAKPPKDIYKINLPQRDIKILQSEIKPKTITAVPKNQAPKETGGFRSKQRDKILQRVETLRAERGFNALFQDSARPTLAQSPFSSLAPSGKRKTNKLQFIETPVYFNKIPKAQNLEIKAPKLTTATDIKLLQNSDFKLGLINVQLQKPAILQGAGQEQKSNVVLTIISAQNSIIDQDTALKQNLLQQQALDTVTLTKQTQALDITPFTRIPKQQKETNRPRQPRARDDKYIFPKIKVPSPRPTYKLVPEKPPEPIIPKFPRFGAPSFGKVRVRTSGFRTPKAPKQSKGYSPSAFAATFKIKGSATKLGQSTGLGFRPIETPKKRKRRSYFNGRI